LKEQSVQLRDKILEFMRFTEKIASYDEVTQLIEGVNKFNLATRSYRPKRLRGLGPNEGENL
jgi:hypothetical protein